MFVKVCGTTSEEDALLAVAMGADAVGFIFAPSPRQVSPAAVREIVGRLESGQTFHRVTKATGSDSRFEVQTSNAVAAVRELIYADCGFRARPAHPSALALSCG